MKNCWLTGMINHVRIQKIFFGREGGVQIPRRGLTENFNMAKINNLAIPEGGGDHVNTKQICEVDSLYKKVHVSNE